MPKSRAEAIKDTIKFRPADVLMFLRYGDDFNSPVSANGIGERKPYADKENRLTLSDIANGMYGSDKGEYRSRVAGRLDQLCRDGFVTKEEIKGNRGSTAVYYLTHWQSVAARAMEIIPEALERNSSQKN
ncbi:MAG: hypothetical protein ACE5J7_04915 [Candidatus Aenigmatarchaeota archaeon]